MRKYFVFLTLLPLFGCSHEHHFNTISPLPAHETLNNNKKTHIQQQMIIHTPHVQTEKTLARKIFLDAPLIKQNPELKYGCEVTSIAMMLQYAGTPISKIDLYKRIKKDPDPIIKSGKDIIQWGDPNEGFVGDMTGKKAGYAVFDKPIENLVNFYLPNCAVNLSNQPFTVLEDHLLDGYPIVVWTTGDYRLPDRWEAWKHHNQTISTPLDLHAVLLVGFDQNYVYINDPLSGRKQVKVNKTQFISSWIALKSRAISYQKYE